MRRAFHDSLGVLAAGGIVLVFCLLLLRHDPHFFWVDDYQISILPVFTDMARSWSEGHWPLLSPYSWACGNLAGEFQYGTFSLFVNAAVVLIWKFPLTFAQQAAALSIAHLMVLAAGGYWLGRGRKLAQPFALLVGIVAALNGWMLCWGASDWFAALAAFAWLPWAWWALEKALKREGPGWRFLLPAPFIYLLIAGGFPYTVIMLGLLTGWLILQALVRQRDWRAPFRLSLGWLLGLGLSAPAWIALLDYAAGSRRATEVFLPRQWLVPLRGLPGLILPAWTVPWREFEEAFAAHPAIELACGLVPAVVLVAALGTRRRKALGALGWEFGLLALVVILCLLPSAGIFRFSFRWLPFFHLILALIAAELLARWPQDRSRFSTNPGAWAILLVLGVWLAASIAGLTSLRGGCALPWTALVASVVWAIGHALLPLRAGRWLVVPVALATLLSTYLVLDPHEPVARYGFSENLRAPAPLDPERLYLSLYLWPPVWYRAEVGTDLGTLVRPGSTSLYGAVHLINGYSPVGPAGVARLFDFGTHGHINPARLATVVLGETGPDGLLAHLGIDGLIVARNFTLPAPLPPNEWKLVVSEEEGDVYHRAVALPPARVLSGGAAAVRVLENSRQQVVAAITNEDATRPARLIFSRPYFPGYQARLGPQDLPVDSWQGLAPTVEIPPGQSGRLTLSYRPRAVVWGGPIAALSLVLGVACALKARSARGA